MKAIRALLLVLTISVSAYAGEMECGRTGEIPNDKTGDMDAGGRIAATDPVTEIGLQVLQSMLPLF
jgi:hypothetical protein